MARPLPETLRETFQKFAGATIPVKSQTHKFPGVRHLQETKLTIHSLADEVDTTVVAIREAADDFGKSVNFVFSPSSCPAGNDESRLNVTLERDEAAGQEPAVWRVSRDFTLG